MTKVAILPVHGESGTVSYRAVAGDKRSEGSTAGAALDALTAQLSDEETATFLIVQSGRPDRFFSAIQHQRLAELMSRWRSAQEQGQDLPSDVKAELETLIDAELRASAARAGSLADELGR
jgi:hypothetical protein